MKNKFSKWSNVNKRYHNDLYKKFDVNFKNVKNPNLKKTNILVIRFGKESN